MEETKEETVEIPETIKENVATALPLDGEVKAISESSDPVFAQKTMGDGILVIPANGKVYAPDTCKIEFVFPTKHAIGITTKTGVSMLIHCGIDTVKLDGKGYKTYVNQGETVEKGTLLLEFDIEEIKAAGYSVETPVVVTNLKKDQHIEVLAKGMCTHGSEAFSITE